jgi:signal transduction histidine kinase
MKISPQKWRVSTTGRTVNESMHRDSVGLSLARAVPGPGIELLPVVGPKRFAPAGRAGWALVTLAALSGIVGLAVATDRHELLRTGLWSILLTAGATALVIHSQRRVTAGAIDEERRRIARNLHDGLAQELAFIRMETQRMAATHQDGRAERLALAAQRALEESRGAIETLRSGEGEPFHVQLSELAGELATREGARVTVQVDPALELETEDREALLRIMREAISNGVRHGHATEVVLELSGGDNIRMAVRDNGAGFVPGGPRRRGSLGLASMRARAEELGGNLFVQSAPGEGTLVEVKLPW